MITFIASSVLLLNVVHLYIMLSGVLKREINYPTPTVVVSMSPMVFSIALSIAVLFGYAN